MGWSTRVTAGRGVRAVMSARAGGHSQGRYASCNLGAHVGDAPEAVDRNRAALGERLGGAHPVWLNQVHGNRVVRLSAAHVGAPTLDADGALTTEPGVACVVMVADCLPILLMAPEGKGVAALHAGWRGLAGAGAGMAGQGIVHTGVLALCDATAADPQDLQAWLGPCIGPAAFEVGADVLTGFGVDPHTAQATVGDASAAMETARGAGGPPRFVARRTGASIPFDPGAPDARWLADLPGLAADVLGRLGVRQLSGGQWCTVSDASRYFSFRRDGVTGRQAAGIWLT